MEEFSRDHRIKQILEESAESDKLTREHFNQIYTDTKAETPPAQTPQELPPEIDKTPYDEQNDQMSRQIKNAAEKFEEANLPWNGSPPFNGE